MYDPAIEAHEFIGLTRKEAVEKACRFFASPEEELEIVEVDATRVSGLGSRVAVVARPRGARRARRPAARREGNVRARPRTGERAAKEAASTAAAGRALTSLSEVGNFVKGLLERMQVGGFEIGETMDGELRVVRVRGPAAVRLTGGDGRAADAVQLLANQVALRIGESEKRVVVDVEGDPERRAAYLERLAERVAKRAKESGRAVALEPMNPKDRWTVHVALRDAPGIATMSVGQGRYRQVVVVPEGAPEYEEAVRYEATAGGERAASEE